MKIVPLMRQLKKCGIDRQARDNSIIGRMCITCSIIDAPDTHSKHVIFNALLRKNKYSHAQQCYIIVYLLSYGGGSVCFVLLNFKSCLTFVFG